MNQYIDDSSSISNASLKLKATRTTSNKNKTLVSISVLSPKNKRKYVTDNKRANKKVYVARTNNESSLKKIVPEQVVPRI